MAVAGHVINVQGRSFAVRLGWNAIRRIEEILKDSITVIGMRMVLGQAGARECGVIFWAGLETARVHDKSGVRLQPWSIEEVGDLIDELGSDVFFSEVYPQLVIALTDAFPSVKKAKEDRELAEKQRPTTQPETVPAGTGTGS